MESRDFQFDLAIHVELMSWFKNEPLFAEVVLCSEDFFFFKEGILYIDFSCISQEYYTKFIEPGFGYFCYLFGNKLQLIIGEFFLLYDFPPARFLVEIRKDQINCMLKLNIRPQMMPLR
jgi:hypothetical protein